MIWRKLIYIFSIIIVSSYFIQLYYNYGVEGYYNRVTQDIKLFTKEKSFSQLDTNYLHERCHKIWHEYLNETQRLDYTLLFEEAYWFVSEYGETDPNEDFAESCRFYLVWWNEDGINLDKTRETFFKTIDIPKFVFDEVRW